MWQKLSRKLKVMYNLFHPKITIERQSTLHFDFDILQLVIVHRKFDNGKSFNSVWLIGEHKNILHKLYHWSGQPNNFGKRYQIKMRTFNYWIEIQRPHKLSVLCRKCKIKKVIVVQMDIPYTANGIPYFLKR